MLDTALSVKRKGDAMTLFEEIQAAGLRFDNRYSDLYVKDTPTVREILESHRVYKERFKHGGDGTLWWDVPGAYAPYWDERFPIAS